MSTKDLFSRNYLTDNTEKSVTSEIESVDNLKTLKAKQDSFLPQVDYSDPQSFAKYGSAFLYYKTAVERIIDYYPYDGSDAEINSFYNKSLDIEKYIFNNRYPRTNGYVTISANGWGTTTLRAGGYGDPKDEEHITFMGGPNAASQTAALKTIAPDPSNSKFQYSNVYDEDVYDNLGLPSDYGKGTRTSNLKSNFDNGVTVEFWTKTGSIDTSLTEKQVILDVWNNELSTSVGYGRITIELDGTAPNSPWLLTVQSGTTGIFQETIGASQELSSLSDWKHYAIAMYNTGSDFAVKFYANGELDDTNTYSSISIPELNPRNMKGRLGALLTAPSGTTDATTVSDYEGAGKLSGSLDEFRFWKVKRDAAQIGRNWFTQVRGGVNTDVANTTLGLYYKFNEGITTDSSLDSVVLDYGGRICNGAWTGYTTNSRNTGSAIVSASAAAKEYLDPIVYTTHPDVSSLKTELTDLGTYHDAQNNGRFLNLIPAWVIEETQEQEESDLEKLSHIIGAYFDKIYLQISAVPKFKHLNYTSASHKPLPFSEHLPSSLGLMTPEIFVDSTITEKFANRTDTTLFDEELQDTKNLIYQNLYNNVASIFKSKGTERSIRSVLRCFNVDDNLVYLSTYANNQTYILQDNLKQTQKRKKQLSFNESDSLRAVVYQSADPSVSDSLGYISGSGPLGLEDKYGFTVETSTHFPKFYRSIDKFDREFTEISIFGMHSASVDDPTDTTIYASDVANFQVTAVRDAPFSKNVYFKLTSSVSPHPFDALTSSLFYNVYDNEDWNFSVALKPSNYPYADVLDGSDNYTYDVVFRGYNNKLGTISNQFEITSSVSKAVGQSMLRASKRIYVGAQNDNITGSTNAIKSDVLFNSAKYWTKYIDPHTLKQHAFDRENFGISGSYRNVSALDTLTSNQSSYNFNTLALNWYFGNVTTSDASGEFYVTDLSSGSAFVRDNFGWAGQISGKLHTAKASGFEPNSTKVVENKIVNEFKFTDPEQVISSDMVKVLSNDDELFGLFDEVPNYVFTIEKSLHRAVSEEILDFFAGVVDFNNVIGDPAHRYRMEYKPINHLRSIFFEKFSDIKTVEKFTEYFRWFDDALSNIIEQLVPASADLISGINDTIESHVLERNKYQSQFPTIEFKTVDPEGSLLGIGPLITGYTLDLFGGVELSPRPTNLHKNFWKKKARPGAQGIGDYEISSGDATIDAARRKLKDVMWRKPVNDTPMPTLSNIDGTTYQNNKSVQSLVAGTAELADMKLNKAIKGGVNFEHNKDIHYTQTSLYPAGPVFDPSGGVYVPQNVLFAQTIDLTAIDPIEQWNEEGNVGVKRKRHLKVVQGRDYDGGLGYTANKNTFALPFNVMSASIVGGIDDFIRARTEDNLTITNLHNDVYGSELEVPMQGAFTNYAVGGHQSRHIKINTGGDDYTNRPEAWKLLLGKCSAQQSTSGAIGMVGPDYPWPEANNVGETPYPMTASQKAVYYRDHIAKRPVNIRNIQHRTGSTILGNYEQNYEIVHTFGAFENPRNFIENQPALPAVIFQNIATSSTQTRTFLDVRRTSEGHFEFVPEYDIGYISGTANKTVITTRFDGGAGLLSNGNAYRDFRSNEFSVYNNPRYRHISIIKPSQTPAGMTSEVTGAGTPGIRMFDIHGRDFGLRAHSARHTARFGRDSTLVTNPGASYDESPGFHKIHRNNLDRVRISGYAGGQPTYATQSQNDNFFVQHQIPRSTKQYAWITASLQSDNGISGFVSPDFVRRVSGTTGITYEDAYDFVSASDYGSGILSGIRGFGGAYAVAVAAGWVDSFIPQVSDLNLNIYESLTSSTNTLGLGSSALSDYINEPDGLIAAVGTNSSPNAFNNLMIKRNGTFGYPTWKRMRQQNHPILVNEKQNNQLSVLYRNGEQRVFDLRPVSQKGRPVYVNMDFINSLSTSIGGVRETRQNTTFKTSYNNEMVQFNEQALDDFVGINFDSEVTPFEQLVATKERANIQLNWILYSENVFPSTRNEFSSASTTRVGYDNLYWRDAQADRLTLGLGGPNSLGITGSTTYDSATAFYEEAQLSQSAWTLDAPSDFETRAAPPEATVSSSTLTAILRKTVLSSLIVSNSAGELQNTYSSYFFPSVPLANNFGAERQQAVTVRPSALYARKHMLNSPLSIRPPTNPDAIPAGAETDQTLSIATGSGEAKWEAPTQAGYLTTSNGITGFISQPSKPFYNDYDSFRQDIKSLARGYAVVPEFRLSEQIENYTKFGIQGAENFDTFTIPGTTLSSSQETFYKDLSNSDFLRNFADIKNLSELPAKEVKLTCRAAIKFNPYKGFYPAQRSTDLVSQFSSSYGESIDVILSRPKPGVDINPILPLQALEGDTQTGQQPFKSAFAKSVYTPLFAPGILYNSIKSGLAVDYPIITDGSKLRRVNITGSLIGGDTTNNSVIASYGNSGRAEYLSGAFWDVRLPFETIIDPSETMAGLMIPDIEPHKAMGFPIMSPSASVASKPSDKLYTLMASNYFAEIGKFFLKNNQYTKLESNGVNLSTFKFAEGETYGARLRLKASHSGSRTYNYESGSDGSYPYYATDGAYAIYKNDETSINIANNSASIWQSGSFELPQDPNLNPYFRRSFVMYDRATAFGPPVAGREFGPNSNANNDGIAELFALSASTYGVKDSLNGYNWSFTPPYYDGEAWVDFIFRPSASVEYDLQRILTETKIVQRRYDPGPDLPGHKNQPGRYRRSLVSDIDISKSTGSGSRNFTPYASENINANAMQVNSSINLFGVENVFKTSTDKFGRKITSENEVIAQRWIVQPKFETPMMNFFGVDKATAGFGDEATPRGMWHQFGRLPSKTSEGIFLEMGAIPGNWLQTHYEVVTGSSEYNNYTPANGPEVYKNMKSFARLMGFTKENSKTRLGELSDKQVIKEAVVAIPYISDGLSVGERQPSGKNAQNRKRFINIPKKRFQAALKEREGSKSGDSLSAAGASIRKLVQKMNDYVLPPQFDFINNKRVSPMVMYMFEFKYELDKDDLSYIWQNLAPRDYEKMEIQQDSVAHELINTELLDEQNLLKNPNLRWMIFKVKQRSQANYTDMVISQVGEPTTQMIDINESKEGYRLNYNWPYDYVSIVESIKTDVEVLFKGDITKDKTKQQDPAKQNEILSKKRRREHPWATKRKGKTK